MIHEKVLFVFCLLTLCSFLLILWEFLSWKKNFWHHPNISLGPTWKNTFFNCLQIIFASIWNILMILGRSNIFSLFLSPFWRHGPQNICPCQISKNTRWFLASPNWWFLMRKVAHFGKFAGFRVQNWCLWKFLKQNVW